MVGAGHAGGRAAQLLREAGWDGRILLVGDEAHAPYERPPLSKAVLTGEQDAARCALREAAAWETDRIERVHARVAALDPGAHAVVLEGGRRIGYHRLLLATGGRARRLQVPGAELPDVLKLRTVDDALALAPRLAPGRTIVVVGGGFIGLEVAASARQRGCEVHVVEGGERLLGRAVPQPIAARVERLHRRQGVAFTIGTMPTAIERTAAGLEVRMADGAVLPADTVVVGIGIEPAVELARDAGLALGRGIRVDATLQTSAPAVYAIGDAAEFPSPLSGEPIRLETWHNAETQARTAARNLLGAAERYSEPMWFWSDQYDHQLQVAGEPALAAGTITRALGADGELNFHLGADGRLVGASGFGRSSEAARELKIARMLVERRAAPEPARLQDPATKLKSLLA